MFEVVLASLVIL